MSEPRLRLIGADLCIARDAPPARPAPAHERYGHSLPNLEFLYPDPRRGDPTHQLMPGNMGQGDGRVVAGPRVMIAAAHPGGLDVDDDARIGGSRCRDLLQLRSDRELIEDDGTHTLDRKTRDLHSTRVSALWQEP